MNIRVIRINQDCVCVVIGKVNFPLRLEEQPPAKAHTSKKQHEAGQDAYAEQQDGANRIDEGMADVLAKLCAKRCHD